MSVRPFSKSYVLNFAVKKLRSTVDQNISYTTSRLRDFKQGDVKWQEVLDTTHALHELRQILDEFVIHNPQLFKEDRSDG